MVEPGLNYRLSDIHPALAASQLMKLDRFVERRRMLVARYHAVLAPLIRPAGRVLRGVPAWYLYVALIDFAALGCDRARVMGLLRLRGIGSQVHYLPLHRQPYYRDRYGELERRGADTWYARALSLPLFAAMCDEDVDQVAAALEAVVVRRG